MIQTALKVTAIDHIVLYLRDMDRAKRFYVDLLGMEVYRERPGQVFLRCGTQQIGLFTPRDGVEIQGDNEVNHMALRLAFGSNAEVKAVLDRAGIRYHGRTGDPDCIYLEDPDGHGLQLLPVDHGH